MRTVKCPKCGLIHETAITTLQWRCPNCKMWIKVELGRKQNNTPVWSEQVDA